MKLSLPRRATVARIAAGVLLGASAVVLFPDPARAATATIQRTSDWYTGHVASVTVFNNGSAPLTSWRVEFDLPPGTTIANSWSVQVFPPIGNHYVFTNASWNGNLAPGASTVFGYIAHGNGAPFNCTINGDPCSGVFPTRTATPPTSTPPTDPALPDREPPSKPTNLRWTTLSINALWWDAATDDRGVVGYEVYERGRLLGTVTGLRWDLPGPPPPVTTVYGVSAVDAAGNKSPLAVSLLGPPTDNATPTAPTDLRLSLPSQGYLKAQWTASTDDLMVVGYEVELNGTLIRTVGGTTAYVPAGSFGVFFVAVRAIDSAGKYSPYVRQQLIIEPPVTRT